MTTKRFNVHGTAIVLGTRGFLLVGASGTGKSTLALTLMQQAKLRGLYAALVSDDQVFIAQTGEHLVAHAPEPIRGLLEIRGAGIVTVETIASAVLHVALSPVKIADAERLPPACETHRPGPAANLPLLRLPYGDGQDSFSILERLLPYNSAF